MHDCTKVTGMYMYCNMMISSDCRGFTEVSAAILELFHR
jgi:hypothetical protein